MGQVTGRHGTDLIPLDGRNGRRFSIERQKFDLESCTFGMDVDYSPHIAGFEAGIWHIACQNDAVMFFDHGYEAALSNNS